MKKWLIVLLSICSLYLNCCFNNSQDVTPLSNLSTTTEKETIVNRFFFQNNESRVRYKLRLTPAIPSIPNEVDLLITKVSNFENGTLYELRIDCSEDFPCRNYPERDRFHLGYFYVQKDRILMIRKPNINLGNLKTGADILNNKYTIVCHDEGMEDKLEKNEKGWHERILINGNKREYYLSNTQVETGYYERFIWEEGKGLVEYKSGLGAESCDIWLQNIAIKQDS